MTEDARFEDGAEQPLRLRAEGTEDLDVIAALVQDAVVQPGDVAWLRRQRRFVLLLNRFRWEDAPRAERQGREFERVRSLLDFGAVLAARTSGIDPRDRDLVLSLLSLGFEPDAAGGGIVRLIFAGDGEIALDVECLDARLADVTRPYLARSGQPPRHPDD